MTGSNIVSMLTIFFEDKYKIENNQIQEDKQYEDKNWMLTFSVVILAICITPVVQHNRIITHD